MVVNMQATVPPSDLSSQERNDHVIEHHGVFLLLIVKGPKPIKTTEL